MEELLKSEGVVFDKDGCVRLDKHLWKPGKGGSASSRVSSSKRSGKRKVRKKG